MPVEFPGLGLESLQAVGANPTVRVKGPDPVAQQCGGDRLLPAGAAPQPQYVGHELFDRALVPDDGGVPSGETAGRAEHGAVGLHHGLQDRDGRSLGGAAGDTSVQFAERDGRGVCDLGNDGPVGVDLNQPNRAGIPTVEGEQWDVTSLVALHRYVRHQVPFQGRPDEGVRLGDLAFYLPLVRQPGIGRHP